MKNLLLILSICFCLIAKAQAPINDEISGAIPMCYNTNVTGSTTLATKGIDENGFCISTTPTAPGVWYSFTGNGQAVEFNTCSGSNYDTHIFLYTGISGLLACVTMNDDACLNKSLISFQSVLNEEYLILVSGYSTSIGDFGLELTSSIDSMTLIACNDYISPSGNMYTSSTIFLDTLPNTNGCDSITYFDLTINNNIQTTINQVSPSNCVGSNNDTLFASSNNPAVNSHLWYDAPTGGNLLFNGDTFAPNISSSANFYVTPNASTPAPIPTPNTGIVSGNTYGYWFTASSSFIITSLSVPVYNNSGSQSISVVKFDNNMVPPTLALNTNDFSTLYLTQANPTVGDIQVNIPINEGEVIGFLGTRGNSSSLSNALDYTIINSDTIYLSELRQPGNLITTAPYNLSDAYFSGYVGMIDFSYINTDICIPQTRTPFFLEVYEEYLDSIVIETCDSYISPIGDLYTGSSSFMDTLQSVNGCDSLIFVDLTLEYSTSDSMNISACDTFVSPSGKIFTSSAIFTDTLYTNIGCSILKHIDLSLGQTKNNTINETACDSYTSPLGILYTSSGIYFDTLVTSMGCDSILEINLTVNNSYLGSFSTEVCDSFISAQGDVYDTSSVFYDTLTTSLGCDSVLYTTLTLHYSYSDSLAITACDSYTSPMGILYNTNAIFSETFTTINGCDSTYHIDLIINNSATTNITLNECNSYISPIGTNYTSSSQISDTLMTVLGCDSIINIDLTINYNTLDSIYPAICGTYTSPLGNVYTSTSLFNETYTTIHGCDSVVSIFLTVHPENIINITPYSCGDYTSPAGNVYTSSAVFTEILTSTFGCDSTYNIDLTIPPVSTGSINPIVCNQYITPLGFNKTDSEIFTEILVAADGCDSILNINLTINKTKYDTTTIVTCGEYISPSGQQYLTSGIFEEQFTSAAMCDSFYVLDISISPLSLTIDKVDGLLSSLDLGATYQWYDCIANKILSGDTNRTFQATENGAYKVIVEKGSCMDTSVCVSINSITAIKDLSLSQVLIYPNPTKGNFNITIDNLTEDLPYECYNAIGKRIKTGVINNKKTLVNLENNENGIYFIKVAGKTFKVIKTQ